MFKLAGLGCITAALGLMGMLKASMLKERIVLLEEFLQMILNVRGRINYFREPLSAVFAAKGKNDDLSAFKLLNEILTGLEAKDLEIGEIWAQKALKVYKDTPLTEEDMQLIIYPGKFIGQTDYENQLAQFDYLEKSLEKQILSAREDFLKKGPLYRKIGFFAGGIASMLFI